MSASPLVSVVVVNYLSEATLPETLESVRDQSYRPLELVLVDNGSPEFFPGLVEQYSPEVLIELEGNPGFAAGNNAGIRRASGDFILTLNPDATLGENWIETAVETMRANPEIGWLGGSIVFAGNPEYLDSAGHLLYRERVPAGRGHNMPVEGRFGEPEQVFGHSACCCLYRKSALEQVARGEASRREYFARRFHSYFEDADLDWRLNRAGWSALYHPGLLCRHWGGISGGHGSFPVRLRGELNLHQLLWRNISAMELVRDGLWIAGFHMLNFLSNIGDRTVWAALQRLPAELYHALTHRAGDPVRRVESSRPLPRELVTTRPAERYSGSPDPPEAEDPPEWHRLDHPLPETGESFTRFTEHGSESGSGEDGPVEPTVSVIVLNLNGLKDTLSCLSGLADQTYPEFEVVVVDNGSSGGDAERIAGMWQRARLVRLEQNRGFTGGVNRGLREADGQLAALLNNDAVPEPGWLEELVETWRERGTPAVSSVIVHPGESAERARNSGTVGVFGQTVPGALGESETVYYPSGGACLLDPNWLRRHGCWWDADRGQLFPPHYFAYYEDVWLGLQIQRAGAETARALDAVVRHEGSRTAERELSWFRRKYLRGLNRLRVTGEIWKFWWQLGRWPGVDPEST